MANMIDGEQGMQDRTETEGKQDMELGQDMGEGWKGRRGSVRHDRRGRQSRVSQGDKEERKSIRGGKRQGRRPKWFPLVTFPAFF
jgi:hypothetical protein